MATAKVERADAYDLSGTAVQATPTVDNLFILDGEVI
jgi:hypothetical protein